MLGKKKYLFIARRHKACILFQGENFFNPSLYLCALHGNDEQPSHTKKKGSTICYFLL